MLSASQKVENEPRENTRETLDYAFFNMHQELGQVYRPQCGRCLHLRPNIVKFHPYFRNLSNLNFRAKIVQLPLFYVVHKLTGR